MAVDPTLQGGCHLAGGDWDSSGNSCASERRMTHFKPGGGERRRPTQSQEWESRGPEYRAHLGGALVAAPPVDHKDFHHDAPSVEDCHVSPARTPGGRGGCAASKGIPALGAPPARPLRPPPAAANSPSLAGPFLCHRKKTKRMKKRKPSCQNGFALRCQSAWLGVNVIPKPEAQK